MQVPSAKMMGDDVTNLSRSGNHCDRLLTQVDIATPEAVLHEVQAAVYELVRKHPAFFAGPVHMYTLNIADPLKLQLGIHVEYSCSYENDNYALVCAARTSLNSEIARVLAEYRVTHTGSRIPTQYTVSALSHSVTATD